MEKIQCRFILEILGRPPEHIVQGLQMIIEKLKQEKGIKIQHFNVHEPVQVKDSKDLYTTFADIEVEVDSLHFLFTILFNYMPANFEVIYPEKLTLDNNELNQLVNELAQRLHNYDAIAKNIIGERNFLLQKIKEISPQLYQQITTPPQTQQQANQVQKKLEKAKKKASKKPKNKKKK